MKPGAFLTLFCGRDFELAPEAAASCGREDGRIHTAGLIRGALCRV